MNCPNCNRELHQTANFCRYCGAPLPNIPVEEHPAQTQPEPAAAKKRILPGALAALALLLVLLGIALKSYPADDASKDEKPMEIISQTTGSVVPEASSPTQPSEPALPINGGDIEPDESLEAPVDEPENSPEKPAEEKEQPAQQPQGSALWDGEYILTVYSDQLYPADEGVYADVDVHQYVTLDKEILWDAQVGDVLDLTQFNVGYATVTNVSAGSVTYADGTTEIERTVSIQVDEKVSVYLGEFIYRESFGCWRGIEPADGGFAIYHIGTARVLFPPTTGITDYYSYYNGGKNAVKCEEGMVHADIRDFFALYDYPNVSVKVNVTLQNNVVTEAVIYYHP